LVIPIKNVVREFMRKRISNTETGFMFSLDAGVGVYLFVGVVLSQGVVVSEESHMITVLVYIEELVLGEVEVLQEVSGKAGDSMLTGVLTLNATQAGMKAIWKIRLRAQLKVQTSTCRKQKRRQRKDLRLKQMQRKTE
jgi:hypothetical protein